jgi:hypothetical protein
MNVDTGRFSDAVAIMFPLDPNSPFTMGFDNLRVQILHWKAIWQKDIDEHFQDVQVLHPNFWSDLYWFSEGEHPHRVPEAFGSAAAQQYFIAKSAGNPVAQQHRKTPVEELLAEGFGTLTNQPQSVTQGKGVWKDGRWSVVFRRPLKTDDPIDYTFVSGESCQAALAVWEGSAGDVGGRKQYSMWVTVEVPSQ